MTKPLWHRLSFTDFMNHRLLYELFPEHSGNTLEEIIKVPNVIFELSKKASLYKRLCKEEPKKLNFMCQRLIIIRRIFKEQRIRLTQMDVGQKVMDKYIRIGRKKYEDSLPEKGFAVE